MRWFAEAQSSKGGKVQAAWPWLHHVMEDDIMGEHVQNGVVIEVTQKDRKSEDGQCPDCSFRTTPLRGTDWNLMKTV